MERKNRAWKPVTDMARRQELEAEADKLSPLEMARFWMDNGLGYGDYTAEREELLAGITMEDFEQWLAEKNQKAES
jgi:hypothetical protein